MAEHLKTLTAIFLIAVPVLLIARAPACAAAIPGEDFRRRRNLWLVVTALAFLTQDFWLLMGTAGVLLFFAGRRDPNPMALFLALLFAVPALTDEVSGLGLARHLLALSYPRLLALAVLLPAALAIFFDPHKGSPASKWPDRLLAGYLALILVLQFTVDSLTNTLRYAIYYFIDVALPYYVASRSLKNLEQFRDTAMSLVVAAMVLAAVGIFETAKGWLLYASLDDFLGLDWGYGNYLQRGESLRAQASTGQPIALGFVMAVACGLFLFLRPAVPRRGMWFLGLALLLGGLLAPISRGPWIGAAVGFAVFVALGPRPLENLAKLALLGLAGGFVLLFSPFGDRIIDHLPFIGTLDRETIAYRQELLNQSVALVKLNPLFGSFDYLKYMEDLRQGQGIIDIVNTYLAVALSSGLAGLGLFVSFFLAVAAGIHRARAALPDSAGDLKLLGRSLLATLAGIMVIIFTVSSITVIPIVYWSVAGFGLAYIGLAQRQLLPRREAAPLSPPGMAGLRA